MLPDNTPLVSIIIPAYNLEKYIAETIQTALDQTWSNKEIIVVDDGSTDATLSIAREFEKNNTIVRVIAQNNSGACNARNNGFNLSKGEFIQFLDGDDLLAPDKIEIQMRTLMQHTDCIIGCKWVRFEGNVQNILGEMMPHESISKNLDPVQWLLLKHMMSPHGWLCPRNIIERSQGWDETLACNQDGEFFFRVVSLSKYVYFEPETIVYYRHSPGHRGINNINSKTKVVSIFNSALSYKRIVKELTNNSEEGKIAIGNYFKQLEYEFYPRFADIVQLCREQEEYRYANCKPRLTGLTKLFARFLGWKLTMRLKYFLK